MKLLKLEISRILKKSILLYLIILGLIISLVFSYFIIDSNKEEVNLFINKIPLNILKILDISKDKFATTEGYFIFIVKIISIIIAFYSLNQGIWISTMDKRSNTRDFLYTKPIKRKRIIQYRVIAQCLLLFIISLFLLLISSILYIITNKDFSILIFSEISLALFILSLAFFFFGATIGGFKNGKTPNAIVSLIIVIIFMIINITAVFLNNNFLIYINPFSLFKTTTIIETARFTQSSIWISLFIIVFFYNFSVSIYEANLNIKNK
jgi:ABC-2 type transport system permease protein